MRKVPGTFQEFAKKYPKIISAYESLAGECRHSGPLSERDQAFVKLGVAVGSHTEGLVRSQVRKALDLGMSPDEIRHSIVLALTSIGFPRMMASLSWAEDIIKKEVSN